MKARGFFGPSGVGKTPPMAGVLRDFKAASRLKSADRFETLHA